MVGSEAEMPQDWRVALQEKEEVMGWEGRLEPHGRGSFMLGPNTWVP